MKVAVVDDDPIVCSSIATMIDQVGAGETLWTANDGEQAIRHYASQRPDVLLMDIQMPTMGGLDAARSILQSDPTAKILFLTTFADRQYIQEALGIGGRGYLIKQDVASIIPAVQTVLAGEIVLGSKALSHLELGETGQASSDDRPSAGRTGLHADDPFSRLTNRERRISALIAEGLDNHDIARQLYLSEGTVRNRISEILAKLGLANRTQIAILWLRSLPR
ncbi:response regulator [Bifidobacterium sp.]|uniref:response regulator n=1 Tax=Bifidobacterium sp. TaxID=41200 RepID=UPI0039E9F341